MVKYIPLVLLFTILQGKLFSQDTAKKKLPFKVEGTIGFTYEGYGLNINPKGSNIYSPRRPWNQLRFIFTPTLSFGKDFKLPLNFNFATKPTNFAGPYAGIKKPTVGQFLTNPANNFSINPTYKWAELQLGTQYLNYSELSTGDVGIFGAGFHINPLGYTLRFFAGTSQQAVNYVAPVLPNPGTVGSYQRNHWMLQVGKVKENNYKILLNIARGEDRYSNLISPPPTILPQEGAVMSLVLEKYFKKGWFFKTEGGVSAFTKDLYQMPASNINVSLKPFIKGRASTQKDKAITGSIGKKSTNFDLSYSTKYIGAGYLTTGYPYLQPDRWDNTINTKINAWKNKINIVASFGQRINNLSNTSLTAKQLIGSLNWFTQFSDRFSTNITYNNFGFTSASGFNPYGIRNVSNDLGLSTNYSWSNTKRMNMLTFSYNLSKYDERDVITRLTTSNNTHTLMLSYIPTYFNSSIAPDFSILYFNNSMPLVKNTLVTLSSSLSAPAFKNKMQLRGQVQYTIGKLNSFSSNKNFIASCNMEYKLSNKLSWNIYLASNYFKYGDELMPTFTDGANYLESNYRTGLQYKF